MNEQLIGIFDSGVGGLTVYRAIRARLPKEKVIYLGDTARIPYGTRSPATVRRYAHQDAAFLYKHNVKMLVVACNTISSVALESLQEIFPIPILGVIEPGARRAVRTTRNGRVGVIATEATVESDAYRKAIHAIDTNIEVFSQACPLFVALAEEGWSEHAATRLIATEYLAPLKQAGIDTLVLGCTHYPLLRQTIQSVIGEDVILLDSGECAADEVESLLTHDQVRAATQDNGHTDIFCVTDSGRRFRRIATLFLGTPIENLIAVDIWDSRTQADSVGDLDLLANALNAS
ncbi:MAG: glutamate racemase [Acidobacteriota bacterium]